MDYQIKRSKRKTAAIHVTPEGVEVRVPYGIDLPWISRFVASRQAWIQRQQDRLAERLVDQPHLGFGESLWFKGLPVVLTYLPGAKRAVCLVGDQLQVIAPNRPDLAALESQVTAWFLQQAKDYMPQHTYGRAQQLGVMDRLQQIRFRRTKSKWGHCTSQGNLQFNWQIMGAPPEIIDYLICHEVAHLLEHNHSQRFWALVEQLCPLYQQHRAWLKHQGHRLIWS